MAKLRVSPELLIDCLFRGGHSSHLEIRSAAVVDRYIEFDIVGPDVPEVEQVVAHFTHQRLTVVFKPA